MLRLLAMFFVFTLFSMSTLGRGIVLSDQKNEVLVTPDHYVVIEDVEGKFSAQEVLRIEAEKNGSHVVKPNTIYWILIPYKNESQDARWVFEGLDHHTDELSVYTAMGEIHTGSSKSFFDRFYKVKNLVFDVPNDQNGVLVIKMKASYQAGFEFKFRNTQYLLAYATTEYYILGLYYGVLFIMALYNLLLYFSGRERVYLYYIFYVVACILVSFEEDGLGFQYFWPSFPWFNTALTKVIAPIGFMVSFIGYSVAFLELKKRLPRYYKITLLITAVYLVAHVLNVIIAPNNQVVANYYFIPFSFVFAVAVLSYRKGNTFSRYFILGNAFIFLSIIIGFMREHYLIPANILTVYSFNIGVLVEIIVLSFALGDRLRTLRKEKDRSQHEIIEQLNINKQLQTKVNRELEEKVQERTRSLQEKTDELEEANQELTELRDQLREMNEKLDLDNWKLTKQAKEQTAARLYGKGLSFEEFISIFPDDFSCLKHLETLKWGKGFTCKKCQHDNYSLKPKLLTHKCSKCGYEESVTSGTLFHGLRFPIQKAYFMTYLQLNDPDRYTLEELAGMLDIHRNTCSKFNAKVREVMKANDASSDIWESVLKG